MAVSNITKMTLLKLFLLGLLFLSEKTTHIYLSENRNCYMMLYVLAISLITAFDAALK